MQYFTKSNWLSKTLSVFIAISFLSSSIFPAGVRADILTPPVIASPVLKYLSVNPVNPNNYFNFLMDRDSVASLRGAAGTEAILSNNLTTDAKKLINYFFLGLSLPQEAFWVNLQPNQQDKLTSEALKRTDLGKILLEQDLQLKKDVAKYLHPDNPVGKVFWTTLYQRIGDSGQRIENQNQKTDSSYPLSPNRYPLNKLNITTNNRVWVVPDQVNIAETEDGALITKASLKVLLESEYLRKTKELKNLGTEEQVQNLSESLMKQIIIPEITKDVNTSPRYAPLRQIYHSLILAQWYKQKQRIGDSVERIGDSKNEKLIPNRYPLNAKTNPYAQTINSNNTQGLESALPWSKDALYQEYLKSYKQGEYNVRAVIAGLKRMYFSGGLLIAPKPEVVSSGITNPLLPQNLKEEKPGIVALRNKNKITIAGATAASPLTIDDNIGPRLAAEMLTKELDALDLNRMFFSGFKPDFFAQYYLVPFMEQFFPVFGRYATLEEVKDFYGIVEDNARSNGTGNDRIEFANLKASEFINEKIGKIPARVRAKLSEDLKEFKQLFKSWLDSLSGARFQKDFSNKHMIVAIKIMAEILKCGLQNNLSNTLVPVLVEEAKIKSVLEHERARWVLRGSEIESLDFKKLLEIYKNQVAVFSTSYDFSQSLRRDEKKRRAIADILENVLKDLSSASSSAVMSFDQALGLIFKLRTDVLNGLREGHYQNLVGMDYYRSHLGRGKLIDLLRALEEDLRKDMPGQISIDDLKNLTDNSDLKKLIEVRSAVASSALTTAGVALELAQKKPFGLITTQGNVGLLKAQKALRDFSLAEPNGTYSEFTKWLEDQGVKGAYEKVSLGVDKETQEIAKAYFRTAERLINQKIAGLFCGYDLPLKLRVGIELIGVSLSLKEAFGLLEKETAIDYSFRQPNKNPPILEIIPIDLNNPLTTEESLRGKGISPNTKAFLIDKGAIPPTRQSRQFTVAVIIDNIKTANDLQGAVLNVISSEIRKKDNTASSAIEAQSEIQKAEMQKLKDEELSHWVNNLKADAMHTRLNAIKVLGKLKDSRAVEPLIKALRDVHLQVLEAAVEALGEFNDPKIAGFLVVEMLKNSGNVQIKDKIKNILLKNVDNYFTDSKRAGEIIQEISDKNSKNLILVQAEAVFKKSGLPELTKQQNPSNNVTASSAMQVLPAEELKTQQDRINYLDQVIDGVGKQIKAFERDEFVDQPKFDGLTNDFVNTYKDLLKLITEAEEWKKDEGVKNSENAQELSTKIAELKRLQRSEKVFLDSLELKEKATVSSSLVAPVGGIDLASMKLEIEKARSLPEGQKVSSAVELQSLYAAYALSGLKWDGLAGLYFYQIMLMIKDGIAKDLSIEARNRLIMVGERLKLNGYLGDNQSLNFFNQLKLNMSIGQMKVGVP